MRLRLLTLQRFLRQCNDPYKGLPAPFGADLRGLGPVHACTCGCTMFNALVSFEDYDISWWHLDATCGSCGNLVRIPCPVDHPEYQE